MKNFVREQLQNLSNVCNKLVSHDLLSFLARCSLAAIFWMSGRTKVSGWIEISDSAIELFQTEYDLPIVPPEWGAHLAAYAEHLFPILLVLGLMFSNQNLLPKTIRSLHSTMLLQLHTTLVGLMN